MPENEYNGLSAVQQKALKRCLNARDISTDYVRPFWSKFVRMYNLHEGVLPEELDGTLSKIMLNLAFSAVQGELPRAGASLFSTPDFFSLDADTPFNEFNAKQTEKWLKYQVEKKIKLWPRILPTLQSVGIFGTGYRAVGHTVVSKKTKERIQTESVLGIPIYDETETIQKNNAIVSQYIDIFSGLPSPTGGIMNPADPEIEGGVDWFIWMDYMSEDKIKSEVERGVFDRNQAAKLLDGTLTPTTIDAEFAAMVVEARGGEGSGTPKNEWLRMIEQKEGLKHRHQIMKCFFRDKWIFIGDEKTVLYEGTPPIDWIPIAKYVDTPNLNEFFGKGVIEVIEDLILAILLNFNFRLDYVAGLLHPTKFVSQTLLDHINGDTSRLDPRPYNTVPVPAKVRDIRQQIWYDRYPEITPQAFMEETGMKAFIQEIAGQPNYSKGMGGIGTLANETATGILSLIERGDARSTLKSLVMEYVGLQDELTLILKWAKEYIVEDQFVRTGSDSGFPWEMIDADVITDGYGITLNGTRSIMQKHQTLQKMLALLPMFLNNPNVPGQQELLKEVSDQAGVFQNIDAILGRSSASPLQLAGPSSMQPPGTPGMIGGQDQATNQSRSVAGRTTVEPETGSIVPVEYAV